MFLITFLIFLFSLLAFYLAYRNYKIKERKIALKSEDIKEHINITRDKLHHQEEFASSYKIKLRRYEHLENILEMLNAMVLLEEIGEYLVKEAWTFIAQLKGNVILYLLNKERQRLEIFKTHRLSPDTIIKAKEGDVFDYWVMKQSKPLLVEDAKTDFRFDREQLDIELGRKVSSLISNPLISKENFLGILRVDAEYKNAFNLEDLRLLSTISDIAAVSIENAFLYQKINELATIDGLTQLYQREYFLKRLEEELGRLRYEQKACFLLMIDIDYFKNYNDHFGHAAGDIVLKRVASLLREFTPHLLKKDYGVEEGAGCCRFGGEEFLVYLSNISDEEAKKTSESLRRRIEEEKIILRREKTSVTVSIGVAKFPDDATPTDDLIKIVDQRMYKAKTEGRNRVCFS